MSFITEYGSLLWTRLVTSKQQTIDFFLTATTYYGNYRFAKIDLRLLWLYRWNNPFRIARKFLADRGDSDVYTYGETPLTTMDLIATKAGIAKTDTVLELGCGRGRTCFWLHEWLGCRVTGIEHVPSFVKNANEIKDYFQIDGVTFVEGDYQTADWGNPTVVYLYASNLSESEIKKLALQIQNLPRGTKVISISYAIPGTTILRRFQLPFTWGEADVYIQVLL